MLNIAIMGCGNISNVHMESWMQIPGAKIVAGCDIRPERTAWMHEKTGGKEYSDFDTMLNNEKIDILDICLPTNLHAEYAIRGMDRGIHVLLEKPISLKIEDVDKVYAAAKRNNVRFMVAQVLRFWHEYLVIKEAYESGEYGRLVSASMTRLGRTPSNSWDNWMNDKERSGLTPFDLHIHDLDFMVHAFGAPKSMVCRRATAEKRDDIHVFYRYDDFFIYCEAAWVDVNYVFNSAYRFQFEDAVFEYSGGKLTVFKRDCEPEVMGATSEFKDANVPTTNAYFNEIRYFTDCVLSGQDCDRVKAEELKTVLECISGLHE